MAPFIREQNSTRPTGLLWPGPGVPQDGTDTPPEAHINIDPVTGGVLVTSVGGGGGPAAEVEVTNFPADYARETTLAETNLRIGDEAEAAAATDTSTIGLNGLVKRSLQHASTIITNFVALLARLPTSLGQKTSDNSLPVVMASDQPSLPVTVGNFPATQPVNGTVAVSNLQNPHPVSGPLTDTQLRALPVPVSAATAETEIGATNESAAGTDTATSGLNGLLKRLLQRFTVFIALLPASIGQKTSAGSLATVLASDQSAIPTNATVTNFPATQPVSGSVTVSNLLNPHPISATSLPLPAGAATEATLSTLNGKVTVVNTGAVTISTALPTGTNSIGQVTANAGTNLNTSLLGLESTQVTGNANIGATNESAAASDTATSGLNGLIKRFLQQFTTHLSRMPAALGQTTMANSLPVTFASNQSALPVSGTITATISGNVTNIPQRPSQGTGRTHVSTGLSNQNSDQTVYTVTATKTFYLTTLILTAFNSSIASVGTILVRDGAGGTIRVPYLMQQAGVGALVATQPLVPGNNTFQEPIPFTTSVYMDITAGAVTYSVGIVGYEE